MVPGLSCLPNPNLSLSRNVNKRKNLKMKNEQSNECAEVSKKPRRFDLVHFIKWIILILLVVLVFVQLFTGEMDKLANADTNSWIILVLKLVLIIVIIYLMRIQRCLKCQIIEPDGCTPEETDMTEGIQFIEVKGTASGYYFSHYTLGILKGGSPVVTTSYYPGGGGERKFSCSEWLSWKD